MPKKTTTNYKRHCERMQSENRLSSSFLLLLPLWQFCFLVSEQVQVDFTKFCLKCNSKRVGNALSVANSDSAIEKERRIDRRWGTGENSEGKFFQFLLRLYIQLRFIIIALADEKILVSMTPSFERHTKIKPRRKGSPTQPYGYDTRKNEAHKMIHRWLYEFV